MTSQNLTTMTVTELALLYDQTQRAIDAANADEYATPEQVKAHISTAFAAAGEMWRRGLVMRDVLDELRDEGLLDE